MFIAQEVRYRVSFGLTRGVSIVGSPPTDNDAFTTLNRIASAASEG